MVMEFLLSKSKKKLIMLKFIKYFVKIDDCFYFLYVVFKFNLRRIYFDKGTFPNALPVLIKGDGDGIVNKRSLRACAYWMKLQNQPIYLVPIKGGGHALILQNNSTLEYIKNLLI